MIAREKLVGASGACLMVALLGYALLVGLRVARFGRIEPSPTLLAVPATPPPPVRPVERRRSRAHAQAPSPRSLKNEAAPVVAPPPVLPLLPPPPVRAAEVAGVGAASSAGASDRTGPGEGAGGRGSGPGGGEGEGDGDFTPPRFLRGELTLSDLPEPLRNANGRLWVNYLVGVDGRVTGCRVTTSSGNGALDAATCRAVERKFRYKPSRDPSGRKVASHVEDSYAWLPAAPAM